MASLGYIQDFGRGSCLQLAGLKGFHGRLLLGFKRPPWPS